jgi:hypothetical protein
LTSVNANQPPNDDARGGSGHLDRTEYLPFR